MLGIELVEDDGGETYANQADFYMLIDRMKLTTIIIMRRDGDSD
jgi:hypothetical protein